MGAIKWVKSNMTLKQALDYLNPDKCGARMRDKRGAYKKIENIITKLQDGSFIQCEFCDRQMHEGCMCCRKQIKELLNEGENTSVSIQLKEND